MKAFKSSKLFQIFSNYNHKLSRFSTQILCDRTIQKRQTKSTSKTRGNFVKTFNLKQWLLTTDRTLFNPGSANKKDVWHNCKPPWTNTLIDLTRMTLIREEARWIMLTLKELQRFTAEVPKPVDIANINGTI